MARTGKIGLVALGVCCAVFLPVAVTQWAVPCEAGEYLNMTANPPACADCPTGKFSPEAGAVGDCHECSAGTYQNEVGQVNCTLCDAGKYSKDGSKANVDDSKCVECTSGKYLPVAGVGPWRTPMSEAYRPYVKIDPPHGVSCGSSVNAKSCAHCPITQCGEDCEMQSTTQNYTILETNSTYATTTVQCQPVSWNQMGSPCEVCEAGKFSDAGASICTDCPSGEYSETPATGSLAGFQCKACGANTESPAGSVSLTACTCSPEYYGGLDDSDADPANHVMECTSCGANAVLTPIINGEEYCENRGFTEAECNDRSRCCHWNSDQSKCYSDIGTQTCGEACQCKAGYFGGFADADATELTCTTCPAGKVTSAPGADEDGDCSECPAGKFAEAGDSVCTDCAAGKYAASEAAGNVPADCVDCGVGKYSATEGAIAYSSCVECPAGEYNNEPAASACKLCVAGKFVATTASDEVADCEHCAVGKYSVAGASACGNCIAGKYSAQTGAAECTLCENGKYQSNEGATDCLSCGADAISHEGSDSKTKCKCPAGKHGTFDPDNTDPEDCVDCPAGKSNSVVGATSDSYCEVCERGKFSVTAASSCTDCPAGKYLDGTGSYTVSDCVSCGANTESPAGSASLTACTCSPEHYGGLDDSDAVPANHEMECTSCGTNAVLIPINGEEACEDRNFDENACNALSRCCHWNSDQSKCYSDIGTQTCLWTRDACQCKAGYFGGFDPADATELTCETCPDGKVTSAPGADVVAECFDCPAGKFAEAGDSVCTDCAAGKFAVAGSSECTDCVEGKYSATAGLAASACIVCGAGKYAHETGSTVCTDCGAGKYLTNPEPNLEDGHDAEDDCTACDASAITDGVGKTAKTDCICDAGKYGDPGADTPVACQDCSAGKYLATTGATVAADCLDCGAGKYSDTTGVSSCTNCPCGFTSSPEGSDGIADCEESSVTNEPSASLLKTCGPNDAVQCVLKEQSCYPACDIEGFASALDKSSDTYHVKLTDCMYLPTLTSSGRCCKVEIKYQGIWGTISMPDDYGEDSQTVNQTSRTASMICRKVGCSGDNAVVSSHHGMQGHVDGRAYLARHMIWMSVLDLNCTGSDESDILPCMTKKWGEGDGNRRHGVGAGSDFENPHDGDFGVCCHNDCVGTAPPTQRVCSRNDAQFYYDHLESNDCRYLPAPSCKCDSSATEAGSLGCV